MPGNFHQISELPLTSTFNMASLLGLILAVCFGASYAQQGIFPDTVPELDLSKYLGRWYQTHASPFVMATYEKDAVCVTADYGLHNASTVTVYNANRHKIPTGALDDIHGFAYTTPEPGKLYVNLDGVGQGDYWVIKLGPKTYGDEGLYEYSVVTEPLRINLFVLARDVTTFRDKHEAEVLEFLKNNGFNSFLNRPIETYHEDDCVYAPKPSH